MAQAKLIWVPRPSLLGRGIVLKCNMTNDSFHSYTYDAENKVLTVDGTAMTYKYDALGRAGGPHIAAPRQGVPHRLSPGFGENLWESMEVASPHLKRYKLVPMLKTKEP